MEYSRTIPQQDHPTAVALGLFDGLHRGHRAVIGQAVSCAPALRPAVFTFTFDGEATKPDFANILTHTRKLDILRRLGAELVCEPPFSSFRELSPRDFFEEILVKRLRAAAIFCGEDYRFGKNAAGDAALLRRFCAEAGVRFHLVAPLLDGGEPVSSTRIRRLLRDGEMAEAARLLGEPYIIDYPVSHGRQLGRKMGYPTINQLYPAGDLLPRSGVYAAAAFAGGSWHPAVTNVGVKPTLGGTDAPSAETTLLDFDGDLYGQRVPVAFFTFLRPEQRFDSVELLFEQVARDAKQSARLFPEMEQSFLKKCLTTPECSDIIER